MTPTTNHRQSAMMRRATVPQKKVKRSPMGDPVSALPPFLQILVSAYPNAWATARTFVLFARIFADRDAALLNQAAEAYVLKANKFPTVAEFNEMIEAVTYEQAAQRSANGRGSWLRCQGCGERSPDPNHCPFCLDMLTCDECGGLIADKGCKYCKAYEAET